MNTHQTPIQGVDGKSEEHGRSAAKPRHSAPKTYRG
ncbi:MAG: hypothetical protein RSP_18060 [Rhodanobacter sp.]